ncbi:MAG: sigma-70 family RNA polymerase sigma factor [Micromonosporaceae bacterium]|nr:sigma-70 family RNA polymerase sigma factor [Micromonosporaceae bacterium]
MLAVAAGDGQGLASGQAHASGQGRTSIDVGATSTKIRSAAVPAKPDGAHGSHPRPRVGSDGPAPAQGAARRPAGGRRGTDTRGPEDDRGPDTDGRLPPAEVVGSTEIWRLVERAQAGDVEAFGQIYDRYLDTVFRYVYFRVGSRTLAEDLTQEAFLRALRRINSFTWQGRDLGAWLVTIARNLVADHFKSGRYRLEMSTSEVIAADREDRGPEGSPEAAVVSRLTNATLLKAVKRLGAEQQECIVLRFLQGFSVAETARAMGKNEGAIKALQYRAVRALARLLPEGFSR